MKDACIRQPLAAKQATAWCGRSVGMEWHFQGLDHYAASLLQEQGLRACSACLRAVGQLLQLQVTGADTTKEQP